MGVEVLKCLQELLPGVVPPSAMGKLLLPYYLLGTQLPTKLPTSYLSPT